MSDYRLRTFVSVAKNLSFTKAAQELFLTQPAITKHIQSLEAEYHVRLFERSGNKISLTKAGERLLEKGENILESYRQLEYEMHLFNNDCNGELRLGASTTISQYVLPSILAEFIKNFPHIHLSLLNGNSQTIENQLQEHRIDLGLVEGISRLPNLKYSTFMQDELVAVIRTKSRLKVSDEISIYDLPKFPLVLRERGSGTLDVVEKFLNNHNIKLSSLNILMYLGSTESIKRFLEQTDCIGIVSIRSIDRELASGTFRVVEIKEMNLSREFCFVMLQGSEDKLAQLFMEYAIRDRNI